MSAEFGIVLPLWSYAADNGELLDRAAGEVGLDHLTVPVVTGAHTQFRLSADVAEPYFHTEGGWHFPADGKAYVAAGVRPIKARWFGSADVLARLCDHATRLGLRLVARIELRAIRELIEREPHLGQRNAWGQEVASAGLCVCNPNVRDLLRATLDDLRRYGPVAFELADWMPDHAVDWSTVRPLAWNLTVRPLLDICFCAACRQIAERASIDPDQAARSVRVQVGRAVELPAGTTAKKTEDDVVAGYGIARLADCGAWLRRLAEVDAAHRYRLLHALETPTAYEDSPVEELVRLPARALPHLSDDQLDGLLRLARTFQHWRWSLPVWRPTFNEPATLVRLLTEATRAGVQTFDLEGLDEAPPEAMTWLKQAVRFARRG